MALGDWFLNGTKLDPNNLSFREGWEVVGGDERMLDGGLRRDVVARKYNLDLSWEYLPETSSGSYHAYTDLRAFGTSGTFTFIRPTGTSTGTEQFKVFVSTPSGELGFRSTGTVFWNAKVNLREA